MPLIKEKFSNKYRIDSTRWKKWDYGWVGYYFVTICTKDSACHFGKIQDRKVVYSQIGRIAVAYWQETPKHFPNVSLDYSIVMPNHIHGIVSIDRETVQTQRTTLNNAPGISTVNRESNRPSRRGVACNTPTQANQRLSSISPKPATLSSVVRSFKSAVSRWALANGQTEFAWQPRFHDRIIRNERELNAFQQYILDNPKNWDRSANDIGTISA